MNRSYRHIHYNQFLLCFWVHFVLERRYSDRKSECSMYILPCKFEGYWIFECTGQNQPIQKFACLQLWWIELIDIHIIIIICDVFDSNSWYKDGIAIENLNVQYTLHANFRMGWFWPVHSNIQYPSNVHGKMYIGHSDFLSLYRRYTTKWSKRHHK